MLTNIVGVLTEEEGATLVEYALIVALIAIACIATITTLGGQIKAAFTTISTDLGKA